jgi:hypothetical protein
VAVATIAGGTVLWSWLLAVGKAVGHVVGEYVEKINNFL